jgi:hypothetical protein
VAGVADPRRLVHGEADVAVGRDRRLARVDTHPYPHLDVVGPVVRRERPLCLGRRLDRRARAAEDDEERVALRVDLEAAGVGEG